LVPVLGVVKAGGGGFELPELMEWVGKCFSSANGEVRESTRRGEIVLMDRWECSWRGERVHKER
jgi:hypothetical protein